jgi:monoamine oxidase
MSDYLRETPEEAGYTDVQIDGGDYLLTTAEGVVERWTASPHFAGYALVLPDGTELEFVSTLQSEEAFGKFMAKMAGETS